MGGLKPIVEFMTFNFAMQAIDHIINSAAKTNYMSGGQMRCPIVFRGPNGAAARVGAQHSQNYGPWYASVPGLVVIAPYSAADAKGLLKAAIRSEDPVVFLENELLYGQHFDVPEMEDYVLPIGKARIVRPGKDVTLVSYSIGVGVALEAAEELMHEGINAEVIDLRTLRPLDKQTVLTSLAKTNRLVVVEEGWPTCSIASEIMAICMEEGFDDLDAPVLRVTNEDVPLPYAANLEKLALIKADDVVKAAKAVTLSLSLMRDRDLVRLYWPVELRPAFDALFAIDDALAEVVVSSTQPALGAIRLAWWREALERLDANPPPPEPRLAGGGGRTAAARRHRRDARRAGGWLGGAARRSTGPGADRGAWRAACSRSAAQLARRDRIELLEAAGRLYAYADRGAARIGCDALADRGDAPAGAASLSAPAAAADRACRGLRRVTPSRRPSIEPEATPGRAAALLVAPPVRDRCVAGLNSRRLRT